MDGWMDGVLNGMDGSTGRVDGWTDAQVQTPLRVRIERHGPSREPSGEGAAPKEPAYPVPLLDWVPRRTMKRCGHGSLNSNSLKRVLNSPRPAP